MKNTFPKLNEELCKKVKLVSESDFEKVVETKQKSEQKLSNLLCTLSEGKLTEADNKKLNVAILKEAQKLERLIVLEAVSDKSFLQTQSAFRSMVRAANIIVKWFHGSNLASKVEELRTQGIELLNNLYEDIKNLESGVDANKSGMKLSPQLAKDRDAFMKVFTDFAIIFRGCMAIADLFTDESYNDMRGILDSLERDELSTLNLATALSRYDMSNSELKGRFNDRVSKKGAGLFGQFHRLVAQTINEKSPGFQKYVSVDDVIASLLKKSSEQLQAYFAKFNQFVSADVDVSFLLNVSKNPRTIGSMFKSLWTAFGSGGGKTMNI